MLADLGSRPGGLLSWAWHGRQLAVVGFRPSPSIDGAFIGGSKIDAPGLECFVEA